MIFIIVVSALIQKPTWGHSRSVAIDWFWGLSTTLCFDINVELVLSLIFFQEFQDADVHFAEPDGVEDEEAHM